MRSLYIGGTHRLTLDRKPGEARLAGALGWVGLGALVAFALLWAYLPVLVGLAEVWRENQDYSGGQVVPFIALYLIWRKRDALRSCEVRPCGWGLAIVVSAQFIRLAGEFLSFGSAVTYSFPLTVAGLVLAILGRGVFHALRWVLTFLFLMMPLPSRLHVALAGGLKTLAASWAASVLEWFGFTIVRQGNVLLMDGSVPIGVAEACSGLRMLTAFLIVAATLVFLIDARPWQKAVLVLSSMGLAVICNLARLCATAALYRWTSNETAERFFHDFAGLSMMPVAIFLLLAEAALLRKGTRLMTGGEQGHPLPAGGSGRH
ncbi:MAG: exosortase/archaeosortase family protein [Phycisphaerae bacterium]|nr:exosortase/archaeosortase family protein [Phycisphaerae bacterium]